MEAEVHSQPAAGVQAAVADLFDNEALWDAADSDEFVLALFRDLEARGAALAAATDLGRNSLLHMAALWNRRAVLEELVRRGADLNARNAGGHTPLDLAAHWGHFELAQQLQHYGGKHTCESERDAAIAQRDLAQRRNGECEAEAQDARRRLQRATQEREAFRAERDRLAELHGEVARTCSAQAEQLALQRAAVDALTTEKHELRVRVAQVADELRCEQAARGSAVQGWQRAEQVVAEMQRLQEESHEREEEALALRNEALDDRDAAHALARQAQLDQGVARQLQAGAERERDAALRKLLDAESAITRDKELWAAKLARVELERRSIQVEIDRQTELLRAENGRLEKQLGALAATAARQRQELGATSAAAAGLHAQLALQQRELASATEAGARLDEQVRGLLDERRDEHRAWRQRTEQSLQQAVAAELHALLAAAVGTWRKLFESQELVLAFDLAALATRFQLPSPERGGASAAPSGALLRPGAAATASAPSLKCVQLPAIQDKSGGAGAKDAPATPRASVALVTPPTTSSASNSSFVTHNYEPPLRFAHDPRVQLRLREAEDALRQQQSEPQSLRSVAEHVTALCAAIGAYLDALTQFALKHLEHLRKQASAQEKMIERKDELLQRFTQHRQEKPKKPHPARFRECSVRPAV